MNEHYEHCGYQFGTANHCNAPIVQDDKSYSGWKHAHSADWLHWATPAHYGLGLKETHRIFVKCAICGKRGPDNKAHIMFDGHKFTVDLGHTRHEQAMEVAQAICRIVERHALVSGEYKVMRQEIADLLENGVPANAGEESQ